MILVALTLLLAGAPPPAWEEVGKGDHCVVYNRTKPGSEVKEVLAIGTFDAPLEKVHAILDDLGAYQEFMPYAKQTRVLKRDGDVAWTYERVNAPLVSERDYTIKVTHEVVGDGVKHVFRLDNASGPKPIDGVVRVQLLDGYWLLERSGTKTKGTYYILSSPGGSLPTFVVNGANNTAVPGLYEAIKKRLKSKP